jgi:putative ABC transport system permease protein
MLGDLEELRHARREREPAVLATVWFWRAALGLIVHALGVRLGEAAHALTSSGGGTRGAGGDLHHAVRSLGRNPGFAAGAILLLALGIGANTAVFSIVRAVLLQPLPYEQPDRLVFLWDGVETRAGNRHGVMTGRHVIDIGRRNTTLESFAAFKFWDGGLEGRIDLVMPGRSERLRGALVTPNFFELLGTRTAMGRGFASSDTEANPVAVLSHSAWRSLFGGDPGIIGRQILLTTGGRSRTPRPHLIMGVLAPDVRFTYPLDTQVFVLMPWNQIVPGRAAEYAMVARLKAGVTAAQAQAELTGVAHDISRSYGIAPERLTAVLARTAIMAEPMTEHMTSEARGGLLLLMAVAALVLLIGCVNLGLLMLARTIDRSGELAVRSALGAGPRRILRLLLVEGLTIAAVGGVSAVAFAAAIQPVIRGLMPPIVPRADQIAIDPVVLAFALAITLVTAVVCGLTPAVLILRRDLLAAVRRSGITTTADRGVAFWRRFVMAVQVAVVLFLLVGAGLLLHSFWRIGTHNRRPDARHRLLYATGPPRWRREERAHAQCRSRLLPDHGHPDPARPWVLTDGREWRSARRRGLGSVCPPVFRGGRSAGANDCRRRAAGHDHRRSRGRHALRRCDLQPVTGVLRAPGAASK